MAVQSRSTLKSWFLAGLKPLANQFADWIDSYWHKSDTIAISDISGLQAALDAAGGGGSGTAMSLTINPGGTITVGNNQALTLMLLRSATAQQVKCGTSAGASDIFIYQIAAGGAGTLHDEVFAPGSTLTLHFTSSAAFTLLINKITFV